MRVTSLELISIAMAADISAESWWEFVSWNYRWYDLQGISQVGWKQQTYNLFILSLESVVY